MEAKLQERAQQFEAEEHRLHLQIDEIVQREREHHTRIANRKLELLAPPCPVPNESERAKLKSLEDRLQASEHELSLAEYKIEDQQDRLNMMSQELLEFRKKNSALSEKCLKSDAAESKHRLEIRDLQRECETLRKHVEDLEKQSAQGEEAAHRLKVVLESQISEMRQCIQEKTDECQRIQVRNAELEDEREHIRRREERLQNDLAQAEQDRKSFRNCEDTMVLVERELVGTKTDLKSTKDKLDEKIRDIADKEKLLLKSKQEQQKTQREAEHFFETCSNLRDELEKLQEKWNVSVENSHKRDQSYKQEKAQHERQISNLQSEVAQSEQMLKAARNHHKALEKEVDTLQTRKAALESSLEAYQSDAHAKNEAFRQMKADFEKKILNFQENVGVLQSTLLEARKIKIATESQLSRTRAEMVVLSDGQTHLMEQAADLRNERQSSLKQLEELKTHQNAMSTESAAWEEVVATMNESLAHAQDTKDDCERLRRVAAEWEEKAQMREADIKGLQAQLTALLTDKSHEETKMNTTDLKQHLIFPDNDNATNTATAIAGLKDDVTMLKTVKWSFTAEHDEAVRMIKEMEGTIADLQEKAAEMKREADEWQEVALTTKRESEATVWAISRTFQEKENQLVDVTRKMTELHKQLEMVQKSGEQDGENIEGWRLEAN